MLGDCQFLAYAIIEPSGSHVVDIPLYTVVHGMVGRVI